MTYRDIIINIKVLLAHQNAGGSFDETRGGIAYAWKWGHIGIVKDNLEWGQQ